MKKIYIKSHAFGAGKWIYRGYEAAWKSKGYTVVLYDRLEDIDASKSYEIMALDGMVNQSNLEYIKKADRCYLYVQPNSFPDPWGKHPNFISLCDDQTIKQINDLKNVYQWCFSKVTSYHNKWKNINYVPLAFDSNNYKPIEDNEYAFDVCFVGGWADNGFDEKRHIMINHFKAFKESKMKCGFFINRDISHEVETKILSNSKICLNIHDAYQRNLGLDTNERTFKSLGLNGCLISDYIEELSALFPDVKCSPDPEILKQYARSILDMDEESLNSLKEKNKLDIIENHTYNNRVESLLCL